MFFRGLKDERKSTTGVVKTINKEVCFLLLVIRGFKMPQAIFPLKKQNILDPTSSRLRKLCRRLLSVDVRYWETCPFPWTLNFLVLLEEMTYRCPLRRIYHFLGQTQASRSPAASYCRLDSTLLTGMPYSNGLVIFLWLQEAAT